MGGADTPIRVAVGYVAGGGKQAPVVRGTVFIGDGNDTGNGDGNGGATDSTEDPASQQLVWTRGGDGANDNSPDQSIETDTGINAASERLCQAARCRYLPLDADRFERRLRLWRKSEEDKREKQRTKEEARIKRARAHGERSHDAAGSDSTSKVVDAEATVGANADGKLLESWGGDAQGLGE